MGHVLSICRPVVSSKITKKRDVRRVEPKRISENVIQILLELAMQKIKQCIGIPYTRSNCIEWALNLPT